MGRRGRWIYYSQLVAWLGSSRVPAVDSRQTSEAAAPSTRTGAHHTLQSAPAATTRPANTSCSTWPPPAAPGHLLQHLQSPGERGQHPAHSPGARRRPAEVTTVTGDLLTTIKASCPPAPWRVAWPWTPEPLVP